MSAPAILPPTRFVGAMTAWTSGEGPNIRGAIKRFWEDFHVREIGPDGTTVCAVTELITPQAVRNAQLRDMAEESGEDWWVLSEEDFQQKVTSVLTDSLLSSLTESNRQALERFVKLIRNVYHLNRSGDLGLDQEEHPVEGNTCGENQPKASDNQRPIASSGAIGRLSRLSRKLHVNLELEDDSKEGRTKFHRLLADSFSFIETKTVDYAEIQAQQGESDGVAALFMPPQLRKKLNQFEEDDNKIKLSERKYIQVGLKAPCVAAIDGRNLSTFAIQQHKQRKRQKSSGLAGDAGDLSEAKNTEYLHFSVLKMNRDSSEAVAKISKSLGRRVKCLSFAGTKDRRGVTVQRMSGFRVTAEELRAAVASPEWDRSVWISDLEYRQKRLKLGDLSGNKFAVVIRDVPGTEVANMRAACSSLRDKGFVNYFGLQRFGTKDIRTHEIGAALIGQKYREAVRLILGDEQLAAQLRRCCGGSADSNVDACDDDACFDESIPTHWFLYKDDAQKALSQLSRRQYVEATLLKFLAREPKGFVPALQQLPRNSLGLYFHAAQSIIWNFVASERIKRFGSLKPVIGDLVITGVAANDIIGTKDVSDAEEESENHQPGCADDDESDAADEDQPHCTDIRPLILDSEEACAKYTIQDVVLPLPGDDVVYPPNVIETYRAASQQLLGVALETLKTDEGRRLCEIHGSYRNLIGTVGDVTYQILEPGKYLKEQPILASDIDVLMGKPVTVTSEGFTVFTDALRSYEPQPQPSTDETIGADNDTAVVLLSCSLRKSSYLTVALREVLCDDSLIASQDGSGCNRKHNQGRNKRPPINNRERTDRGRGGFGGGSSWANRKRPKNYAHRKPNGSSNPLVTS